MNPFYKDYAEYLAEKFPGRKIQKISVNAGFSCPNRDGTIGRGGCIYCDNTSFTPGYCFSEQTVNSQLEAGKKFFSGKYPQMEYLAYFQSYTNTFQPGKDSGDVVESLKRVYSEALNVDGVVGLIIGSRPDCFPQDVVKMLSELNRQCPVFVELGAETSFDSTLVTINRGHTWQQTVDTVERLSAAGISVGLHLIFGLPGETREMMLTTLRRACQLSIDSLKCHHLQVIEGTRLKRMIAENELQVVPFDLESYLELCQEMVRLVPRHIAIERFLASSPPEKVVAPKWGIKNYEFVNLLLNRLRNQKNKLK